MQEYIAINFRHLNLLQTKLTPSYSKNISAQGQTVVVTVTITIRSYVYDQRSKIKGARNQKT